MNEKKDYHIVTNGNGRRILVITDIVYISEVNDIGFDDFDAIFVDMMNIVYEVNRLAIWKVSPILQDKCLFKPIYVSKLMEGHIRMTHHLIDGYAVSPTDANVTEGIENLYARMKELAIDTNVEPISSKQDLWIRLCRFAISRGEFSFTSGMTKGLAKGYTLLYSALFGNSMETAAEEEHALFIQQLSNMGYIHPERFVERVHICPKCHSDHLIYAECCPGCKSSNIKPESVIHHFRCANVSPESTYAFDDQLRCPKCKHFLRHIGVDYDRPANVYLCNECGRNFLQSGMKVLCTECGSHLDTTDLKPYDNIEYTFTHEGIKAFSSDNINLSIGTDMMVGYTEYNNFCHYLHTLSMDSDLLKHRDIFIFVFNISHCSRLSFGYSSFFHDLIQKLVHILRYCQFSYHDYSFYTMYMPAKNRESSVMRFIKSEVENEIEELRRTVDITFEHETESVICKNRNDIIKFLSTLQYE